MRTARAAVLVGGLLLASPLALRGTSSAAADESPALTVERVFGGKPLTTPLPAWAWRPGHAQLVRVDAHDARRALVALDPATGDMTTLLDLASLEPLVAENAGTAAEGIGRAGPPEVLWSADGRAVCVLLKGDLVWADLETGARRRLTTTKAPISDVRIAPDGRHVSFSRSHDLFGVATDGPEGAVEERRLTEGGSEDVLNATLDWVYPEELGHDTATWWSPRSDRVAYLQLDETGVTRFPLPSSLARLGDVSYVRYPKAGDKNPVARVGVVGLDAGDATTPATTWIDLGTPAPEYVARVAWFPDGRRLAVVTLDRPQRRLRFLVADAATRASTVLFEETDPAWVDVPAAPRFLDDRTFLWESHRDGATRWWKVALDAKGALVATTPLTPPDMDVLDLLDVDVEKPAARFAAVRHGETPDSIYVASPGAGDADWAVKTAPFLRPEDGAPKAVLDTKSGYAVVTVSTATTPPRMDLRRIADGTVVRTLGDARSPEVDRIAMPAVEYGAIPVPEGRLRWRLWRPQTLEPGRKYPVVVQAYGGPGSRIVRADWGRGPFLPALLVSHGFLVFEVDGRGTGGQGARFQRLVQGRLGWLELEDQVRGVEMLRERPYVDGTHVGIWGWSFGGTMACNALCRRSDVFRVGVAVAPVTDWRYYDTIYTERYMGLPSENPRGYAETSCLRAADRMGGRLLLVHGMGDDNVHVQNSFRLIQALIDAGKTSFDAMIYPDAGHGLAGKHCDVFGRLLRAFETFRTESDSRLNVTR